MLSKVKVKEALTLMDVAERYSPKVVSRGRVTYILCPFHKDKHIGSCYFYNDRDSFVCKSCGEHGDALRLASGYTKIPLSSLNDLLERIVEDMGWDPERFSEDGRPAEFQRLARPIPDDRVYTLLTGAPFIRTPVEWTSRSINGIKQKIPTRYEVTYFRSMARRHPGQHDDLVCKLSRVNWRKAVLKAAACAYPDERRKEELQLKKFISDFSLDLLVKNCKPDQLPPFADYVNLQNADPERFWTAVAEWQNQLLGKALQSHDRLEEELATRASMFQREKTISLTIQSLLQNGKGTL